MADEGQSSDNYIADVYRELAGESHSGEAESPTSPPAWQAEPEPFDHFDVDVDVEDVDGGSDVRNDSGSGSGSGGDGDGDDADEADDDDDDPSGTEALTPVRKPKKISDKTRAMRTEQASKRRFNSAQAKRSHAPKTSNAKPAPIPSAAYNFAPDVAVPRKYVPPDREQVIDFEQDEAAVRAAGTYDKVCYEHPLFSADGDWAPFKSKAHVQLFLFASGPK